MTDKLQRLRELCETAPIGHEILDYEAWDQLLALYDAARPALPLLIEVAEAAQNMVRYDPEVTSFELDAALDALEREL